MTPVTTPDMTPDMTARTHPAWCSQADCEMDADGYGYHLSATTTLEDSDDEYHVRVSLRLVNWTDASGPVCDGYAVLRVEGTPAGDATEDAEVSLPLSFAEDLVDQLTALIVAARPTSRTRASRRASATARMRRTSGRRRTTGRTRTRVYPDAR